MGSKYGGTENGSVCGGEWEEPFRINKMIESVLKRRVDRKQYPDINWDLPDTQERRRGWVRREKSFFMKVGGGPDWRSYINFFLGDRESLIGYRVGGEIEPQPRLTMHEPMASLEFNPLANDVSAVMSKPARADQSRRLRVSRARSGSSSSESSTPNGRAI